jgi:LacI family transcriptional regulator
MNIVNHKSPTMQDVANRAGVSITTVSHVINKTRSVNQETKEAVLTAMTELRYLPLAKRARTRAPCVGVVLADAREDYSIEMIKAVKSIADDYNVSIVFCDSEADFEKEQNNIETLLNMGIKGLILAPADSDRMPRILLKTHVPVVLYDRQYESHKFLSIGINNFQSAYAGTKKLLERGCKRPGFIGYSDPVDTIRKRTQGFISALLEAAPSAKANVLYLKYNGGDSFPLIKNFIAEGKPDGLSCATSTICYELIVALDTMDETVKRNISIISFDDNRWFDYARYPISVISQPVAEIAAAALENLLALIEKPKSRQIARELYFETTIKEVTR